MNSFEARSTFRSGDRLFTLFRLDALQKHGLESGHLPFSLRILLENLLRHEDGKSVTAEDIEALAKWDPKAEPNREIAFTPARTLLQDFTGVPCVVDLAAMRDAMAALGGDPQKINPLAPVELVIDHSVQVDAYGSEAAIQINRDLEYDRNEERYRFLKWGQKALRNFKAVPPNTGIVHQVNLEYLARVVMAAEVSGGQSAVCSSGSDAASRQPQTANQGPPVAYPDTLVGTDSHTTMVNGLGVLGWGVGGIEAEASMLGQPVSMLIPQVVGFKLAGKLREGATATDLVLTVTEMLRKRGVVGKFVEFFGPGLVGLPVADRATIGNMAPEYGATCGIFPVDTETLAYLRLTGRPEDQVRLVEDYMKEQGLFHDESTPQADYSDTLELELGDVVPSVAGPRRPQDRVPLSGARGSFEAGFPGSLGEWREGSAGAKAAGSAAAAATAIAERLDAAEMDWEGPIDADPNGAARFVENGSVVIAAITSCTNTSNPSVMVAAGLVAKKAFERGLLVRPWVKTSMAPGSRVVTSYLKQSGLLDYLEKQKFNVVGYGCTTCIGNSGPLPDDISKKVNEQNLAVVSVLSGNRNFEGRINADVKANYLMSPPLVVAYALAGTIDIDLQRDPLGKGPDGGDVFLSDVWPSQKEIADTVATCVQSEMFRKNYADAFKGDEKWEALDSGDSERYAWDANSTYVKRAPYFDGMARNAPTEIPSLQGLKVLAILGDSVTTDHISPAGSIKANSPAGEYLTGHGVPPHLFNSYGSRRGNHEVMIRGTFANIRLRNLLAPGTEGGFTTFLPTGEITTIFDAAMRYRDAGTGLIVLAGKEYGAGSSRDWAAKGPALLGVKAAIAESFERIHRSNLVGMGVLPLQFLPGENVSALGLAGTETFEIVGAQEGLDGGFAGGKELEVRATVAGRPATSFRVLCRIDTPQEIAYYRHGGILQYVLRQLLECSVGDTKKPGWDE